MLAVLVLAAGAMWLLAVAVVYMLRRPPEPPVGPRTLDLGPEPPAVANFLVSDFRVTSEAVPATLLDLAARRALEIEQRGPGVFYVRLRTAPAGSLTAYERRMLDHLEGRASDGVVPAEALTTGPSEQSARWRRAFTSEVVADAKARRLSRDRLDGRVFTALSVAAGTPALLVWLLSDHEVAGGVMVGALAILGWVRIRHPQRETPDGLAAASRWLGVRPSSRKTRSSRRIRRSRSHSGIACLPMAPRSASRRPRSGLCRWGSSPIRAPGVPAAAVGDPSGLRIPDSGRSAGG